MSFKIHILAGEDIETSTVIATGNVQHVITDDERATFKLGDSQLKQAVGKYFGKEPNQAYLHSPTPWDDLYKKYGWPQVQTVLVVESSEVLEVNSTPPMTLKDETFKNSSSQTATFNVTVSESVTNTTSSTWSSGGKFSVGQKITYNIGLFGTGGGGENSFSYEHSWGTEGHESKTVTLGSTAGVSVTLKPGESVVAKLSASRGAMKVRIRYKAHLIGITAVNYNPTFKKHHFWDLDIGRVMSSVGITNSEVITEDIELGYYSNGTIEVTDPESGSPIVSTIL